MNLDNFSKVSETTMMLRQEEEGFNNINMSTLEVLEISNWPKVGRLLLGGYNNFPSLRELRIWGCNVVDSLSFLESGFPNLRSLIVGNCVNLRSLTTNHIPHNLESLEITDCPCLESFPHANGNLPPNLIEVHISSWQQQLKPLSEWGLHRLTSLQKLESGGGYPDLVSFPHEYCLLPATLTTLIIKNLPNLVSISSKGLQNLTSLHHLVITYCSKLRSLPKEGLPSTLRSLQTSNCPLLKERCSEEDEGDYWPKIAHIPRVAIETNYFTYG
ncbi:putative disease resistance protein At3g14460 [Cornus florida]|uniref:putative disease resistance protein At3g14460 n=1 Tax=Cornus florida TaxID=4283 RepID=UPI00289BD340|nr:putative disease resistance protein At3g14460 [Cornus florida]